MPFSLIVALMIFGSMLEACAIIGLTLPRFQLLLPKPVAVVMLALGGLATVSGIILLVTR
jgi:hypothetical protein